MVNIVYLSDKIGKLLYLLTIIGGLVLGIFLVNRYLDNKKALLSAVIVYLVVMYIINFLFPLFRDSLVVVFLCLLFWIHRKGYIAAIFTRKDKVTEITATEVKA